MKWSCVEHKKRYPRIERDEVFVVGEDENAHLWAISYSDFLMALLAFFILFFSMDDKKQSQLVLDIASSFSSAKGQGHKAGVGGEKDGSQTSDASRLPAQFADIFKHLNVKATIEKESVVINFPDDFFENGRYSLTGAQQETITDVLEKLKPFQSRIDLYFEGHTDDKPMRVEPRREAL